MKKFPVSRANGFLNLKILTESFCQFLPKLDEVELLKINNKYWAPKPSQIVSVLPSHEMLLQK